MMLKWYELNNFLYCLQPPYGKYTVAIKVHALRLVKKYGLAAAAKKLKGRIPKNTLRNWSVKQ
jgi:hypothetical protein